MISDELSRAVHLLAVAEHAAQQDLQFALTTARSITMPTDKATALARIGAVVARRGDLPLARELQTEIQRLAGAAVDDYAKRRIEDDAYDLGAAIRRFSKN